MQSASGVLQWSCAVRARVRACARVRVCVCVVAVFSGGALSSSQIFVAISRSESSHPAPARLGLVSRSAPRGVPSPAPRMATVLAHRTTSGAHMVPLPQEGQRLLEARLWRRTRSRAEAARTSLQVCRPVEAARRRPPQLRPWHWRRQPNVRLRRGRQREMLKLVPAVEHLKDVVQLEIALRLALAESVAAFAHVASADAEIAVEPLRRGVGVGGESGVLLKLLHLGELGERRRAPQHRFEQRLALVRGESPD
mmetsp:Transcript_23147/g.53525  ORF Transcript_23147/g.53525 Transcript_23147/m.53525 type:complete len:253 (-) Transcript_23147:1791-2549(-)